MRDSKRDTDVKNRLLDSVGEGEGGMIWEISIETCILPYVNKMTSPSFMHEKGHSKPVYMVGGFTRGDTCISVADSCQYIAKPTQYSKVISLQLK